MKNRRHESLRTGIDWNPFDSPKFFFVIFFVISPQVINIVSAKIFSPSNSQLRFKNQLIVITLMRFLSYRLIVKQKVSRRERRRRKKSVTCNKCAVFCPSAACLWYCRTEKSQVHHYFENALHENAPKSNFNNEKYEKQKTWSLQLDVMNDKVSLKNIGKRLRNHIKLVLIPRSNEIIVLQCEMPRTKKKSCENISNLRPIEKQSHKKTKTEKESLIFCPFNFSCKFIWESILWSSFH